MILPEGSPETGSYDAEVECLVQISEALQHGNHEGALVLVLARLIEILLDVGEPSLVAMSIRKQEELRQSAFEALGYPGRKRGLDSPFKLW